MPLRLIVAAADLVRVAYRLAGLDLVVAAASADGASLVAAISRSPAHTAGKEGLGTDFHLEAFYTQRLRHWRRAVIQTAHSSDTLNRPAGFGGAAPLTGL